MQKPIDVYINNLKRLADAKSDTELAKKLALSKQAIAAWRRRQSVPLAQQRILTALYGPEAAFDEDIGYTATLRERVAVLSALLRVFDKFRDIRDPNKDKAAYEHWAHALLAFEEDMIQLTRRSGWIAVDQEGNPGELTEGEVAKVLAAVVEAKQEDMDLLSDLVLADKFEEWVSGSQ